MTIWQQVCEACAGIQRTIVSAEGKPVRDVLPYPQWDAAPVGLPVFVNLVKGGPTEFFAAGGVQTISGLVHMILLLQPNQSGTSLAANQKYVLSWPDAVWTAFAAHLQLGIPDVVRDAYPSGWENEILEYGAKEYQGLRFQLSVRCNLIVPIGM
jgi:hypothetical protein